MQAVDSRLVTPEAVVLQFETSGLGSRLLARIIDTIVQLVAFSLLTTVSTTAFTGSEGSTALIILVLFVTFAIIFVYPAVMEAVWRGRTFGKAALGLRVVTREGAPVHFRHTSIRSALFLVDGLLFGPAIGVLALLLSRDDQRLGDMAAGTLVVRERSGAAPPMAAVFPTPPGCEAYVSTLDTSGVRTEDYEAVRMLLLRAPTFAPPVRHELARQLGMHIATRMHHNPPEWAHPELFLACVASAYQHRFTPAMAAVSSHWPPPQSPMPQPGPGEQWGVAPPRPAEPVAPPAPSGGFVPPG